MFEAWPETGRMSRSKSSIAKCPTRSERNFRQPVRAGETACSSHVDTECMYVGQPALIVRLQLLSGSVNLTGCQCE